MVQSHTNGMQVVRLGHTWEDECQLVAALPCHVVNAIL